MELVTEAYRLSASFPASETYRLTSQMTRAAVSVPANIAEGNGRGSTKDYVHFLSIAKGSLNEVETYLMIALRLDYVSPADAEPLQSCITEVSKMLTVLRRRLRDS